MKTYELRAEAKYREYQNLFSKNMLRGRESALEEGLR